MEREQLLARVSVLARALHEERRRTQRRQQVNDLVAEWETENPGWIGGKVRDRRGGIRERVLESARRFVDIAYSGLPSWEPLPPSWPKAQPVGTPEPKIRIRRAR